MIVLLAATAPSEGVMFNLDVFSVLVYGALGGVALGLVALLMLFLRDRKKGEIW
ncbi:MAG: hypothetical protein MI919_32775 [Holophagales bacterium]|nr:hypothetical protein [Holophagales bacterium]